MTKGWHPSQAPGGEDYIDEAETTVPVPMDLPAELEG